MNCNIYTCETQKDADLAFDYHNYSFELPDANNSDIIPYTTDTQPANSSMSDILYISDGDLCDGNERCNDVADECLEFCNSACHCEKVTYLLLTIVIIFLKLHLYQICLVFLCQLVT